MNPKYASRSIQRIAAPSAAAMTIFSFIAAQANESRIEPNNYRTNLLSCILHEKACVKSGLSDADQSYLEIEGARLRVSRKDAEEIADIRMSAYQPPTPQTQPEPGPQPLRQTLRPIASLSAAAQSKTGAEQENEFINLLMETHQKADAIGKTNPMERDITLNRGHETLCALHSEMINWTGRIISMQEFAKFYNVEIQIAELAFLKAHFPQSDPIFSQLEMARSGDTIIFDAELTKPMSGCITDVWSAPNANTAYKDFVSEALGLSQLGANFHRGSTINVKLKNIRQIAHSDQSAN